MQKKRRGLVVYDGEESLRASGDERTGSVVGGDRLSTQGMEEGICFGHSQLGQNV